MILSPPFLPARLANETDQQFVDRAMTGQAGEGSYPVSFQMNWHGGMHLTAPPGDNNVRAIADGTVAFLRSATPQNADLNHPLNYRGGWTDDGCVIIRHQTEIGADANGAPTSVTFFSIYMHLQTIAQDLAQGNFIHRKQILGTAGRIYGTANCIHFEIICNDTNLQALTGRTDTYLNVRRDGRTDAVFGSIYFLIMINTPFFADDPVRAPAPPPVVYTNTEAHPVEMRFVQGDCILQTYHLDGRPLAQRTDTGFEYNVAQTARMTYPNCASAGYELLRFGRVLGPDALNPPDRPHWRQVAYEGGTGWVNLATANVRKFSDADFPSWGNRWWVLVDGTSSTDSRCREMPIIDLLDSNGDLNATPQEAQQALSNPDVQDRLSRKICKFKTEWDGDASTIDLRFAWLQANPQTRMDLAAFARFKAHVSALCFWQQAQLGIDGKHWHFQPRRFISHFRQCGWLSLDELTQLMPRRAQRWVIPQAHPPNPPAPPHWQTNVISWAQARGRFAPWLLNVNRMFRKYNLLNALRQIQFLAQVQVEIDDWQTIREYSRGRDRDGNDVWYGPFYGRGLLQLTSPANYDNYGNFRQFPHAGAHYQYTDNRITHTSRHHWGGANDAQRVWFPRYDPENVASDAFAACDSAGFFWVSNAINRTADQPFAPATVGKVCVIVNGGLNGYRERQSSAAFIQRYRDDGTEATATANFQADILFNHVNHPFAIFVNFTPQRP